MIGEVAIGHRYIVQGPSSSEPIRVVKGDRDRDDHRS
jgi:hypothetical protein